MTNNYFQQPLPLVAAPYVPWVRPSDWIDITSVDTNEIKLLSRDGYTCAFSVDVASSGTYSIDWGDGTVENSRASATIYQHSYPLGTGTPCSLGYKTNAIRIYNASGNINRFKIEFNNLSNGLQMNPILRAVFNTPDITSFANAFFRYNTYSQPLKSMLHEITMPSFANCTTTADAFNYCTLLKKVDDFTFGAVTNCTSMFAYCRTLTHINLPASWASVTSATSFFNSCTSLRTVHLPSSFAGISNLASFFSDCTCLLSITGLTDWGAVSSFSNIFSNCPRLAYFQIPLQWGSAMTNLTSLFQGLTALSTINLPSSWRNVTNVYQLFNSCTNLRSVILPSSWGSVTIATAMFSGCTTLAGVTLPTTWGSVNITENMFYANVALASITLPSSWGSITTVHQMFNDCRNLREITLPATWGSVTLATSMFSSCFNLMSVNMPANWGSVTNMSYMFNQCNALQYVTPCTSVGSVVNISGMFQFCNSLTKFSFPPDAVNISTISYCFTENYSLAELTGFENVGSAVTAQQYGATFESCNSLPSITIACRLTAVKACSISNTLSKLSSLRLTNSASAFGGSSPQVDVRYSSLDAAALNQLFTDLPTVTGKTINITGCTGAATCTRSIATAKGWTVTG